MFRLLRCGVSLPALVVSMMTMVDIAAAQGQLQNGLLTIKPQYLPPSELLSLLGVVSNDQGESLSWISADVRHEVGIRHNDPANLIVLMGDDADVATVENLIRTADIPPRQIVIEAKIIDIDDSKARDLGVDWDELLSEGLPRVTYSHRESGRDETRDNYNRIVTRNENDGQSSETRRTNSTYDRSDYDSQSDDISVSSNVDFSRVIRLLDQSGAASTRNVPRILTLNNRRATILDGRRITYVTRYSSYTNLYVTDSMDAGLTLSVLPSLGESGYLTLQIRAELTQLSGEISGSPIKSGQIVENTIIVRDGETVPLGGFERTSLSVTKKRFPLLGHILPFLFSRESRSETLVRSIVVLTPRVVDLQAGIDPATLDSLETDRLK